ncbi:hypothetical protein VPH35_036695 [Triticum aestivum]
MAAGTRRRTRPRREGIRATPASLSLCNPSPQIPLPLARIRRPKQGRARGRRHLRRSRGHRPPFATILCPGAPAASSTSSTAISSSPLALHRQDRVFFLLRPPPFSIDPLPFCAPKLSTSLHALLDYETDATAGAPIDYGVDDPSLPEQPDAGAQEPDATLDDDSYYT